MKNCSLFTVGSSTVSVWEPGCDLGQVTQPHWSVSPPPLSRIENNCLTKISQEASEDKGLWSVSGMRLGPHTGNISHVFISKLGEYFGPIKSVWSRDLP